MDAFAEYYDSLVGADYDKIIEYIDSSIKKYKPDSSLVCDLGCGTGTISISLRQKGYDLIAIDNSEDMLVEAREKCFDAGISDILFLNQDIVDFELYGTVDVIYSTLDTLNYITDKRRLTTLFKWVRNYLNYDGLFIFDINSEHKFRDVLDNGTFVYDFDNVFCIWETECQKEKSKYDHFLTYFIKEENGLYSRRDSVQSQRYYSCEEIQNLAEKFDFEILAINDDYSFKSVSDATERITYILKTKK